MTSQNDKSLESHLLILLDRSTKLPDDCLTRLSKKVEAQDFTFRLAKSNPANFATTLEKVVLSNILAFFPILEKTYLATKFQHGVEAAKARQEAADAQLTREVAASEQEGERSAKRQRMGNGENAGRGSRSPSVSSGSSRASSPTRSPNERARADRHHQYRSVQIETGESLGTGAMGSNDQDQTYESLLLNEDEFELAITTAAPPALARIKESWSYLGDPRDFRRKGFHCEREQDMVLSYVIKLDFFILGPLVVEHLSRRVWIMSQIDYQPSVAESAEVATSQHTRPFQRFKALKGMTCAGTHDWIQRVYGEILLWESVQAEVEKRSDAILLAQKKSRISDHHKILKNLAKEAAEREGYKKQKDIARIVGQFERHFYAGLRWRNVAKDFKGSGIIIAFIVAGFGASVIGSNLTEYQRRCLGNLSSRMPKLGQLIQAMGEDALRVYCDSGCLPPESIVSVEELVAKHAEFAVNDDV